MPEMLLEVTRVRQVPGEPRRRWFFCHEQDLFVWFGNDGTPVAFQLCYGKYRNERAIRWKAEQGFNHYSVDDGESGAVTSDTPILIAGGSFAPSQVLARFLEISGKVPREIVDFVAARLREHPAYHEPIAHSRSRPSVPVVIGFGLLLIAVTLLTARPARSAPGRRRPVDE